jgi:hypothetical protein
MARRTTAGPSGIDSGRGINRLAADIGKHARSFKRVTIRLDKSFSFGLPFRAL